MTLLSEAKRGKSKAKAKAKGKSPEAAGDDALSTMKGKIAVFSKTQGNVARSYRDRLVAAVKGAKPEDQKASAKLVDKMKQLADMMTNLTEGPSVVDRESLQKLAEKS